jgi:hypothetical protein
MLDLPLQNSRFLRVVANRMQTDVRCVFHRHSLYTKFRLRLSDDTKLQILAQLRARTHREKYRVRRQFFALGRKVGQEQRVGRMVRNKLKYLRLLWGNVVAQWLRHCATNRKVAGSISDGVSGIFHWHNSSGRTMALGSTQPLTEMSTRNISWR